MGARVSATNAIEQVYDPLENNLEFYCDYCTCDYKGPPVEVYVPQTNDWVEMSRACHCPVHPREHHYC